jgi:4-hydroxy-3-methylbut-2-enyl diphosphate reductase
MRVIRASDMGMCFGVRAALGAALREEEPSSVTIHGELVHNDEVLRQLRERGFAMAAESERDGPLATPRVLITAHGISDAERGRLAGTGAELIDTTCPLVMRVHRAAQAYAAEGRHVVVIGKAGHVEVLGIIGDLEHFDVVSAVDQVRCYGAAAIGIVCQTTFRQDEAAAIAGAVSRRNPGADVAFADTICEPTRARITAVEELAANTDAVVVVGGANSNNSRQLVRLCESRGTRAVLVQGPADLDEKWFAGCAVVGLTAGTSTLDATVDAVFDALVALQPPAGGASGAR